MSTQPRALIFSPYFATRGGGEVYTLQVAKCLQHHGLAIDFAWRNFSDIRSASELLGIKLDGFELNKQAYEAFIATSSLFKKFRITRRYEVCFFVSDGSIPFLFARKNWLHFQVPFTQLPQGIVTDLKLKTINEIICNSRFTKSFIDGQLSKPSQVIYPPVSTEAMVLPKKDEIVAVGRFTDSLHNKRQDVLIEAFAKLYNAGFTSWKLKLIGGKQKGSEELIDSFKQKAKGLPVEFIIDAPAQELSQAYAQAKIFWHAAGFGIDEKTHPELVEHFGIVTVEAMQSGAVPVVINKGGQKEIVDDGYNGFLFESVNELVSKTKILISHTKRYEKMSDLAIKSSQAFNNDRFCVQLAKLV